MEVMFKPMRKDLEFVYEEEPDEEGILRIKGWYWKTDWYEVKEVS